MMTRRSHVATLCIPASHPALPGHFPNRPIVPGVVLLDHVVASAEAWLDHPVSVAGLKQAKFLTPLLPAQEAAAELTLENAELRFALKRGDDLIAQGAFELSTGTAA
jgi:3-hydroxyacyl-[acyl-carrier-protein] dehydratase